MKKSATWTFVGLVFLVPFLAYAGYMFYENKYQSLPVYGKPSRRGGKDMAHTIPSYRLINQDGKVSGTNDWTGRIVVADFFFTHCPTICPKMTASLRAVQQSFSKDDILIRSFSVDPDRNSASQLKRHVVKFGINTTNWDFLTGSKTEIYNLARNGFMIVATDGDGGPADFIHSENLVLIDQQKRIRGYYDGTSAKDVKKLIHDIKKLQNEN